MATPSTDRAASQPRGLPTRKLVFRGRTVLQMNARRAGIVYGPVTVLHAHKGGKSVLRDEARPWTLGWLTTVAGVLVCTRRGSVMVQFRGWLR